ncbi:DUF2271 domain-containing protein [Stieleria sp. JC731]|uniref:DUF2271 domain-containing protein n=1 Tax=Pirellulaceae TaxID=2691357 RepID=UPI001E5B1762|nr:DUF2271 domain-containing protein [Stieleria sp. JC731]MCC9600060.1 DUF2271 domain-containing protein [Stieleria sp. JC731]
MKHLLVWLLAAGFGVSRSFAEELNVSIEIPRLDVSEYHRPYVAVWIQTPDRKVVSNLAVWYQLRGRREGAGTKWLPDLRQWWRRSGRGLEMPVDGVSGATRPAGKHELKFSGNEKPMSQLKPGKYTLLVEASREVGGRELIEIPFEWGKVTEQPLRSEGKEELGEVTVSVTK